MAASYARPGYLQANKAYINTLPLDGIAVYVDDRAGNNITGTAMQPSPISVATISSVLSPLSGITWTTLKNNFGLLYFGTGWVDAYDDAK